MKRTLALILIGLLVGPAALAATVNVSPSGPQWLGYMNVFELDMTYLWGSPWGVPDLVATFNDPATTLTLSPNTIGDASDYWYQGGGGPGHPGNKIMEANLYQEYTDVYNGQTLTFQGVVSSNSFTPAHTAKIFIKDFAPDYSSFNQTIVPLVPGPFSISLATDPGAGRHVQYGFQVTGPCVWFTDVAPFGTAVIRTPEPATFALLGLAGLLTLRRR